jgi:hypothetical protein
MVGEEDLIAPHFKGFFDYLKVQLGEEPVVSVSETNRAAGSLPFTFIPIILSAILTGSRCWLEALVRVGASKSFRLWEQGCKQCSIPSWLLERANLTSKDLGAWIGKEW